MLSLFGFGPIIYGEFPKENHSTWCGITDRTISFTKRPASYSTPSQSSPKIAFSLEVRFPPALCARRLHTTTESATATY